MVGLHSLGLGNSRFLLVYVTHVGAVPQTCFTRWSRVAPHYHLSSGQNGARQRKPCHILIFFSSSRHIQKKLERNADQKDTKSFQLVIIKNFAAQQH